MIYQIWKILTCDTLKNKEAEIDILRDEMATCKWMLWEQERNLMLKEYPLYNFDYEQRCVLREN